jgi:hypothetical protein
LGAVRLVPAVPLMNSRSTLAAPTSVRMMPPPALPPVLRGGIAPSSVSLMPVFCFFRSFLLGAAGLTIVCRGGRMGGKGEVVSGSVEIPSEWCHCSGESIQRTDERRGDYHVVLGDWGGWGDWGEAGGCAGGCDRFGNGW